MKNTHLIVSLAVILSVQFNSLHAQLQRDGRTDERVLEARPEQNIRQIDTVKYKQPLLAIHAGIRLPEVWNVGERRASIGWTGGVNMGIPLSRYWILQLELNHWQVHITDVLTANTIGMTDLGVLIGYSARVDPYFIALSLGPGIAYERRVDTALRPDIISDRTYLLSLNIVARSGYLIKENVGIFAELRKDLSASLAAGGGDSYSGWLLGVGVVFPI